MERRPGRANQKIRTRTAIVTAARDLVARGRLPTVAEVAEAALVSPATAYRYFPDQLSLLRAALQESLPPDEQSATPVLDEAAEPAERVARAAEAFLRLTQQREPLVRAVMALSLLRSLESPATLQRPVAPRPGYRRAWIAAALAPLAGQITPASRQRLANALALVMSSEALVSLQDVLGLDADAAIDVCAWAARTLVQAVIDEGSAGGQE